MLRAAGHVRGEALLGKAARERLRHLEDVFVALFLRFRDALADLGVALGLEVLEREVLELALERLDTEAVRERGVDLERLARDALLRLGLHVLEGPHVVDAIAELDQEHADVACHRDDHLAEVLRLTVFLRREVDLAELGDPVDERGDLPAELALDVLRRRERVLDDVVEQAGADARGIEPELGDDPGDRRGMDEVGVARLPLLPGVGLLAVVVGPPE